MAASGRINLSVTGDYGNIYGYILWSESSVNTTANTSVVTATLYYGNESGTPTFSAVASPVFYLTINGNRKSTSTGITVSAYSSGVQALTHSVTVTHNDDGSKSITISGGGGLSGTGDLRNSSGYGTATLTTILRGKPTASLSVALHNDNAVIAGWNVAVRGYTKVDYTISGTPYSGSGATIAAYSMTGNGQTFTAASGRTAVMAGYGNTVFSAKVKDSRGIWSDAVTQTVPVYDHGAPKITSAAAYRSDSDGDESASGTHIAIRVSASVVGTVGGNNSIASINYTITDSDTGTVFASGTLTDGQTTIVNNVLEENAYVVAITATDTIGAVSSVRTIAVSKSITTFHLAENGMGVAVGMKATEPRSFALNPDWDFYAGANKSDYIVEQGTSGIWRYRKWKSGVCELWGMTTVNMSTVSKTTFASNAVYTESITLSLPFSAGTADESVVVGMAQYLCILSNAFTSSGSNPVVGFRLQRLTDMTSSDPVAVRLYIIGKWK